MPRTKKNQTNFIMKIYEFETKSKQKRFQSYIPKEIMGKEGKISGIFEIERDRITFKLIL